MDLAHPLGITVCQIIIDSNNMHTLTFQGIQICRKGRYKGFTFTCTHLGNTALVKNNTAHQLNTVMLHAKDTEGRLPHNRKGFHKEIIQCLTFRETLFKLICFCAQRFIGKFLHLFVKCIDLIHQRPHAL